MPSPAQAALPETVARGRAMAHQAIASDPDPLRQAQAFDDACRALFLGVAHEDAWEVFTDIAEIHLPAYVEVLTEVGQDSPLPLVVDGEGVTYPQAWGWGELTTPIRVHRVMTTAFDRWTAKDQFASQGDIDDPMGLIQRIATLAGSEWSHDIVDALGDYIERAATRIDAAHGY